MQVRLMFPSREIGHQFEQIAHFAARRARTMQDHDALQSEVAMATPERREHFLRYILEEEFFARLRRIQHLRVGCGRRAVVVDDGTVAPPFHSPRLVAGAT